MANALRAEAAPPAPEIYAADLDTGLAIIEDLGSEPVVYAHGPIRERYAEAVAVLAKLHRGAAGEDDSACRGRLQNSALR